MQGSPRRPTKGCAARSKVEVEVELVFAVDVEGHVACAILQRTSPCVPVGVGTAVDVEGVAAGEEVVGLRFAREDHILVAVGEFDVAIAEQARVVKRDGAARFAELTFKKISSSRNEDEELSSSDEESDSSTADGSGKTKFSLSSMLTRGDSDSDDEDSEQKRLNLVKNIILTII